MSLGGVARRFESVGTVVSLLSRRLLELDSNPVPAEWSHITKVDPEDEKQLPLAYPLYLSHTSAVSVGGSSDVTDRNTEETFELVSATGIPAFHEPSAARHVTDRTRERSDFIAVPEVLNGDAESLVGTLGEGIEYVRSELGPDIVEDKLGFPLNGILGERVGNFAAGYMLDAEAIFEAYIIMNPDSAAAREGNVTEDDLLSPEEAKHRALAAEYHLESEVIYLEYSGTFGGEEATEILEVIDDATAWPRIWYGGGIDSREKATTVLNAGADVAIVGDIFHEVANEEAELVGRARDAVEFTPDDDTDDIPLGEVREWVESSIDLEESAAARYLSTIPEVPNPTERAGKYLAIGVAVALELDAVADEVEKADERAIRAALGHHPLPGQSAFADVLSDQRAQDVAEGIGLGELGEAHDVEVGFPAHHFAVDL